MGLYEAPGVPPPPPPPRDGDGAPFIFKLISRTSSLQLEGRRERVLLYFSFFGGAARGGGASTPASRVFVIFEVLTAQRRLRAWRSINLGQEKKEATFYF